MNQGSSKSLLPLVEILISVGIFAIAVVLTLKLFLLASFLGHKTADTARAIFEVQNIAENIKSMKTDAEIENFIKNEIGGEMPNDAEHIIYVIYYDADWNVAVEKGATYNLRIDLMKQTFSASSMYYFTLDLYKNDAYAFIDDKKTEKNKDYTPLLVSINASKFIVK